MTNAGDNGGNSWSPSRGDSSACCITHHARYSRRIGPASRRTTLEPDPEHPIVDRPWEHEIAALHYHVGLDGSEPYLDLDLERDGVVRRLRFWSPQDLKIEPGFPMPTHGMIIFDVSRRQLDRLKVRVADFEASTGRITFWAREVVDRDEQ